MGLEESGHVSILAVTYDIEIIFPGQLTECILQPRIYNSSVLLKIYHFLNPNLIGHSPALGNREFGKQQISNLLHRLPHNS